MSLSWVLDSALDESGLSSRRAYALNGPCCNLSSVLCEPERWARRLMKCAGITQWLGCESVRKVAENRDH